MQQLEFFAIPSPCIGVCQSGPKGYCIGCFRSREERRYWNECGIDVKRKIIVACARRKKRYEAKQNRRDATIQPPQPSLFDNDE